MSGYIYATSVAGLTYVMVWTYSDTLISSKYGIKLYIFTLIVTVEDGWPQWNRICNSDGVRSL